MHKLLVTYRANPTLANALKLVAWNGKHPFAAVLLAPIDHSTLDIALHHGATGKQPSWQVYRDNA